jgi:para-nitrobenzyl esterase
MREKFTLAAAAFYVFSLSACQNGHGSPVSKKFTADTSVVAIDAGLITGTTDPSKEIHVFLGIPFAAPPVGPLRWREPQPVMPWKTVLACDHFGPSPIQSTIRGRPGEYSEDCLYLNVWTGARQPSEKRPVIVWIYGGGFTDGSSVYDDGEAMARKGIVFVSFNYRVGLLGFLAHPALSRESPYHVSGNYGILDQIAALQWVRRNIAAFGGDTANVTIQGESAGSCSVNTLIASPLAKGLFHRAIAESGAFFRPLRNRTLAEAEAEGEQVMRDKRALTLEAMRALPVSDLTGTVRRLPAVDGYVLPDNVDVLYRQGKISKVDLLTGYNEGDNFKDEDFVDHAAFVDFAQRNYGDRAKDFLALYPGRIEEESSAFARDLLFGWEHYTWAKEESAGGKTKAFMYYFDRVPPGAANAYHSAEIVYALRNLDRVNRPWTRWDATLSRYMNDYWVNFATKGDPNGPGLPHWPLFSPEHTKVMELGDSLRVIPLPAMHAFSFFDPYPRYH